MMDRQLKQRVVGAGLLVAFGVIFIPIFLDNGGVESPVPPSMNIPPAPTEDVSQRAPALGDDAIAEMESQAEEDVELPPSRVQAGEGSTAEPTPVATPSASGEPPIAVETVEEGVPLEEAAPALEDSAAVEAIAPRMQPPEARVVNPPAAVERPVAEARPVPPAATAPVVKSKPLAETPIPPRPAAPKPAAKAPDATPTPKPAERVALARSSEAKPATASKPPVPAVGGWTVQLGSFSSDLNAKKLVDKLKAAGYKAYTEPRLEQGVTVFKVRVGPTPGKAEAERLRQRIEAQFEARGMLVPSR